MNRRAFWLHYNKPASQQQCRNVLTIHWMRKCELVNSFTCHASLTTRDRKSQPRCVLAGNGWVVFKNLPDGSRKAIIYNNKQEAEANGVLDSTEDSLRSSGQRSLRQGGKRRRAMAAT